jgi:adenylosuccinate lyase
MSVIEVDEENMQRNLHMSGGAIAAEPLYLLLEKYGHTSAHEVSKSLAHHAIESKQTLYEVVSQDQSIAEYFSKFNDHEKQILQEPEKYYTGLAAQKATAIHERWQEKLESST